MSGPNKHIGKEVTILYTISNCFTDEKGNPITDSLSQEGTYTGIHNRGGEDYHGIRFHDPSTDMTFNELIPTITANSNIDEIHTKKGAQIYRHNGKQPKDQIHELQAAGFNVDDDGQCPILAIISNGQGTIYGKK